MIGRVVVWLQDPRGSNALPGLYYESWKGFPGQDQGKGIEAGEHMPGPYSLAPALSSTCMSRAHLLAPLGCFQRVSRPTRPSTTKLKLLHQTWALLLSQLTAPQASSPSQPLATPLPSHTQSAPRSCQVYLPALPRVLTRPLRTATAWSTKPASLAWTF